MYLVVYPYPYPMPIPFPTVCCVVFCFYISANASSYANPSVIFACSSIWSKLRESIVSCDVWMCWLECSNLDSITKADG